MDDAREEDLLSLVSKQVHKVLHSVDFFKVISVTLAPLRQQLLTEQEDKIADVLVVSKINVLARILEADLNLVH